MAQDVLQVLPRDRGPLPFEHVQAVQQRDGILIGEPAPTPTTAVSRRESHGNLARTDARR